MAKSKSSKSSDDPELEAMERTDKRGEASRKAWATRRMKQGIKELTEWLGKPPKRVTLWAEDFDRISKAPEGIELVKGPPRPLAADERTPIRR